jgi:hypothetical protein
MASGPTSCVPRGNAALSEKIVNFMKIKDFAEILKRLFEERLNLLNNLIGLEGSSWLLNRDVGEIAGEFAFGAKDNPFLGNEVLLPKEWERLSQRVSAESEKNDKRSEPDGVA